MLALIILRRGELQGNSLVNLSFWLSKARVADDLLDLHALYRRPMANTGRAAHAANVPHEASCTTTLSIELASNVVVVVVEVVSYAMGLDFDMANPILY